MRTTQLEAFYNQLGLGRGADGGVIGEGEDGREYTLATNLPEQAQRALTEAALLELRAPFGTALSLEIGLSAAPLLQILPGNWPDDLSAQIAQVQAAPGDPELRVTINTRALLPEAQRRNYSGTALYYLFASHLIRLLNGPLDLLEKRLFPRETATLVVVSDVDVNYGGELLTIIGEDTITKALALPDGTISQDLKARLDRYLKTARERLNWSGLTLARLTPVHLICEPHDGDHAGLTSALRRKLWHLALLHTANRSALTLDQLLVFYSGAERTAAAEIKLDAASPGEWMAIRWLATWPHEVEQGGADRLPILQNVFARVLDSASPEENGIAIAAGLASLSGQVSWYHRVYIDGKIDKYFQELRTANEYTADVAKKIADSVEALTKGLTDAALAAVAAIFAAIATPLLKNDFPPLIIPILIGVYALNLLVVQLWYRLRSIDESANLLKVEADSRFEVYRRALGEERLAGLTQQLAARWTYFESWFERTRHLTKLLIALIVVVGIVLPILLSTVIRPGSLAPSKATATVPAIVVSPTATP